MPSCVFRTCKNYTLTVKDGKVSFHALPKDGLMREKWLSVIRAQRREDDWLSTKYSTVCSEHFLASDIYTTKNNFRRIKKTAVPVIMNDNSRTGTDDTFQYNTDNSDVEDVKYFTSHVEIPSVSSESDLEPNAQPSYDTLADEKIPKLDNSKDDLENFGKYVTSSLRTLSAENCVHAQDEIQSILSKYKILNLNERRNSTCKQEPCSSDSD